MELGSHKLSTIILLLYRHHIVHTTASLMCKGWALIGNPCSSMNIYTYIYMYMQLGRK